jgi:hypothetical protein
MLQWGHIGDRVVTVRNPIRSIILLHEQLQQVAVGASLKHTYVTRERVFADRVQTVEAVP